MLVKLTIKACNQEANWLMSAISFLTIHDRFYYPVRSNLPPDAHIKRKFCHDKNIQDEVLCNFLPQVLLISNFTEITYKIARFMKAFTFSVCSKNVLFLKKNPPLYWLFSNKYEHVEEILKDAICIEHLYQYNMVIQSPYRVEMIDCI